MADARIEHAVEHLNVQGAVLVVTVGYVLVNFVVEVLYGVLE